MTPAHAAAISKAKRGKPLSPANRAALQSYWKSKIGKPSPKRNGVLITCPVCSKQAYKNQRDLKRVKQTFCSRPCAYKHHDQGKTPLHDRIRDSKQYAVWRKHVFTRDDYTCQACGQRGGKLHADHELPFAQYPDLRFEILNGRTLCEPCHRLTPTWGGKPNPF